MSWISPFDFHLDSKYNELYNTYNNLFPSTDAMFDRVWRSVADSIYQLIIQKESNSILVQELAKDITDAISFTIIIICIFFSRKKYCIYIYM